MVLYVYAALVTVASLLGGRYWLRAVYGSAPRTVFLTWVVALPGSFLVNPYLKKPVGNLLGFPALLDSERALDQIVGVAGSNCLAPVFEESYKFLPVLVLFLLGRLRTRKGCLVAGLVSGFGFGLGEAWYLAGVVPHMPQFDPGHHFLYYSGFFFERSVVVLIHAMLTAIVADGLFQRTTWRRLADAMGLHYVLNSGAALYVLGYIGVNLAYLPIVLSMLWVFRRYKSIESSYMSETFPG